MKNKDVEKQHKEFQKKFNKERLEHGIPEDNFKIVAIGYLNIFESFKDGNVSGRFVTKLYVLWNEGLTLGSLGHHTCGFCGKAKSCEEKILEDKENKVRYYFPKMIFHYMQEHKFKPSNEFIEFVMRTP